MKRATLALLAIALGLPVAPAQLTSQQPAEAPAPLGSTVRVSLIYGGVPMIGHLSSVGPETWSITTPDGQVTDVFRAEIAGAEVLVRRKNTARGILIGGGAGVVAGLLFLNTLEDEDPCQEDPYGVCGLFSGVNSTGSEADWEFLFVGATALAGVALGAIVGTLVTSEHWVPAFVPSGVGCSVALQWSVPWPR